MSNDGRATLVAAVVLALAGCGPAADPAATPPPAALLLYCGAGLRGPVAELAELFMTRHNVPLECDYAGTEVLLSRIKLTGQGDLFLPGDVYYLEQAEDQGLVAEKTTVCYLVPVILVQRGNPQGVRTLQDLLRRELKIGLGDIQACAIGRNCEQIFQRAGIGEQRLAEGVDFRSLTVNELGTNVAVGALDAAIVWDAVAASFADRTEVVAIPPEQNVISTVAIGLLRSSRQPAVARQFAELLASPAGQAVFARHHYTTLSAGRPQTPVSAAREGPEGAAP